MGDRHLQLFALFRKAFPNIEGKKSQTDFNKDWHEAKKTYGGTKSAEFLRWFEERKQVLSAKAREHEKKTATLFDFFGAPKKSNDAGSSKNVAIQNPEPSEDLIIVSPEKSPETAEAQQPAVEDDDVGTAPRRKSRRLVTSSDEDNDPDGPAGGTVSASSARAPAQEEFKKKISALNALLTAEFQARDSGLAQPGSGKRITKIRKDLSASENKLRRLKNLSKSQRKFRKKRKLGLSQIIENDPNISSILKVKDAPGRPPLEDDQPALLETIEKIATHGGAAADRRRSGVIRSCRTLSDLTEALLREKFILSRTATYLRLKPRREDSTEGKRHVRALPVKLSRPQNSEHKTHEDGKFCTATIRQVETLASILGSSQVAIISQDDKARVPLGIAAAQKQGPLLMHVQYRLAMPDHDFVVAEKHKLIPSVYAGIVIADGKVDGDPHRVGYSGPTYIAIRSGKHSSSSASSHAFDFERLTTLPEFDSILKTDGIMKPVVMFSVDGGPDENPRHTKVIAYAVHHFKHHDLDAVFVFTNAPGRSAFNRVERRMAPLTKELAGLILEHDHYGSHLNGSRKTTNIELEKKNFEHAGSTLASVWSEVTIDHHPVVAEYSQPGSDAAAPETPSAQWLFDHVRESKYFLQIVKCGEYLCCGEMRSNLKQILPDGFLPAPIVIRNTKEKGLHAVEPADVEDGDHYAPLLVRLATSIKPDGDGLPDPLPYDTFCPSVQKSLEGKICKVCGSYFATKKRLDDHSRELHDASQRASTGPKVLSVLKRQGPEALCVIYDEEDGEDVQWMEGVEGEAEPEPAGDDLPEVDFAEWLANPWTLDLADTF